MKDAIGQGIQRSASTNISAHQKGATKTENPILTCAMGLSFQETGDHGEAFADILSVLEQTKRSNFACHGSMVI